MQRHHEPRRHHESTHARARPRALDESDSQNEQHSFDDARGYRGWDRDERNDALRAAQRSGDVAEQLEVDAPHPPRSYRPETGLSYDQYRRSRYYDGFEDGQLKAAPTPFRYRHGEYAAGGDPVERAAARGFRAPKNYKRSDARVHEEVCERLGSVDELDPSEIEVEVHAGEVTLRGSVPSRSMRFAAEELAASVFGVEEVHNQLRVEHPRRPAAEQVSVHTVSLSAHDEQRREACEREAAQHWPGARVLVDAVGMRYRAAVYLPEDGVQPDAAAQQSAARTSAGEALEELLHMLRSQPSLRSF